MAGNRTPWTIRACGWRRADIASGAWPLTASAPGFDTLAYVRLLKEVGVDEGQAEAVRDAITEGVATKADIARIDLARIETRITGSKVTMLPAMVTLAGVIAALAKLLP